MKNFSDGKVGREIVKSFEHVATEGRDPLVTFKNFWFTNALVSALRGVPRPTLAGEGQDISTMLEKEFITKQAAIEESVAKFWADELRQGVGSLPDIEGRLRYAHANWQDNPDRHMQFLWRRLDVDAMLEKLRRTLRVLLALNLKLRLHPSKLRSSI